MHPKFNAMNIFNSTQRLFFALACTFIVAACGKDGGSKPVPGNGNGQDTTTNPPPTNPPPTQAAIAAVDDEMTAFMTKYNVPGAVIAITKGEKLVYEKSYGYSDKEASTKAANTDRYRIASLSKQFTAVAILKLVEQGKLTLSATVFGDNGLLGNKYRTGASYNQYVTTVTIDQLLHHTAGGWQNDGNDPMFLYPTLTADQLISWTLTNETLAYQPGIHYAYSNFGYCVLGRVIEKITGKTYAAAVQDLVLTPAGITDMAIGGNTLKDRLTNEVKYYGQSGADPYAYNISRMDSHGGWIASATDLARFLVYVDGFNVRPDIITAATEKTMLTVSSANSAYACGWAIAGLNYYHTGSLPGTGTEQARISTGYNFVILANTRTEVNDNYFNDLDQIYWKAIAKNPTFADTDQFK